MKRILLSCGAFALSAISSLFAVEVTGDWMMLPVKNGGTMRKVVVSVDGKVFRAFDIEFAVKGADWYAALDVSSVKGRSLDLVLDGAPAETMALAAVRFEDAPAVPDGYAGDLRPQFHFSAKRGWLNDPNGLSWYKGEWHLFFQHNPYGVKWGNMHWGHAVSKDLIHWEEIGETLYPEGEGMMFSGSAVVDADNTAGFGAGAHILTYTDTSNGSVQSIAYSCDGRNYIKWSGNPVIPNITQGNRDPRVFWYKPGKHWVLVLYVEEEGFHDIVVFNSSDLKSWRRVGTIRGDKVGKGRYLYECPELFELPIEGESAKCWVVMSATGEYAIGLFDGKNFTPEEERLILNRPINGDGYYAAQTFGDVPDGRRILLPWYTAEVEGACFNKAMGIPAELKLVRTPRGLRLASAPVKEIESLRKGPAVKWDDFSGELAEVIIDQKLGGISVVRCSLRGIPLVYDSGQETMIVDGVATSWPLIDGRFKARVFIDRVGMEIFSSDGLVCIPVHKARPIRGDLSLRISEEIHHILDDKSVAYSLSSIW